MEEQAARNPVFEGVELGVGVWSWGDTLFWGYRQTYNEKDVQAAFEAAVAAGMIFFDTAESYGSGRSEELLGKFIRSTGAKVRVASKFMPYPWRLRRGALLSALRGSLQRLELQKIDLYQMHWPFPPVRIETWMDAMIEAYAAGMIGAVGVSNYDRAQTQRAEEALNREGIKLASNQVEYNLLNRKIEKTGVKQYCEERGIAVIAYSPLGMGLLTGKYNGQNAPRGLRTRKYSGALAQKAQPLIAALKKIGADHGGKTAAQVALNWVICKGAIPIPGAKSAQQAEQNSGAAGWKLTEEEVTQLDALSDKISR